MPARTSLDLSACEREPIHSPGSIQPHGLLFVVDQTTGLIVQSAGDAASLLAHRGSVLGKTAQEVLGISFASFLRQTETVLHRDPAYLATVKQCDGREGLAITGHQVDGIAIIEAEPAARSASAATTLASIRSATERVIGAADLGEACGVAAAEVRRITGYDRVLIYQFLPDGSGSVLAEEKDDHLLPFLNHRYPASDIPKQARDLYRRSAIRVIPDVGYAPTPLVPPLCPTTSRPLDMSHCILRSVSPVHIRYLQNMNVGASMSVSLLGDECLKQVALVLQAKRRPADIAARIGGEEFSIILPDTNLEGAIAVAESVRSRVENLHLDHPKSPMGIVTVSCGVAASINQMNGTVQDLLLRADQALYDAKKNGRNRVAQREPRLSAAL